MYIAGVLIIERADYSGTSLLWTLDTIGTVQSGFGTLLGLYKVS